MAYLCIRAHLLFTAHMPQENLRYMRRVVPNLQASSTIEFDVRLGAPLPPAQAHLATLPLMVMSGQSSYCTSCGNTQGVRSSVPEAPARVSVPGAQSAPATQPCCSAATLQHYLQSPPPRPSMIDISLTLTRQLWSLVLDPVIVGDTPGPASWLPSSSDMVSKSWAGVACAMNRLMLAMQLQTHSPGEG
jgi:hypothetical protein